MRIDSSGRSGDFDGDLLPGDGDDYNLTLLFPILKFEPLRRRRFELLFFLIVLFDFKLLALFADLYDKLSESGSFRCPPRLSGRPCANSLKTFSCMSLHLFSSLTITSTFRVIVDYTKL